MYEEGGVRYVSMKQYGTILFYSSKDRPAVRYATGTTVYEECLHDGHFIGLYWSASGQIQRENVVDGFPDSKHALNGKYKPTLIPIESFGLEIDGQSLHNKWDYIGNEMRKGRREGEAEAVMSLKHRIRPVSVNVITRLGGTNAIVRYLEITNTGESHAALSGLSVFSGLIWDQTSNPMFKLGYLKSTKWGDEGDFEWILLTDNVLRIERTNFDMFSSPFWVLKNETTGQAFTISLAYSGEYYVELKTNRSEGTLIFSSGPAGLRPLRIIAPGEKIVTPSIHIMPSHSSGVKAIQEWHRHLRKSVIPKRPQGKEMYIIAGRVIEEPGDWILREIDIAADMGAEAFMVDAGWYGEKFDWWMQNRGDWFEGGFLPKGGLTAIRDYTHSKGMLFGLWMEPECLAATSTTAAAHPDWQLDDNLINLSNPEAAEYVEKSVFRIMGDFKLDFFKTDYNQRPYGAVIFRDGYLENVQWRHYEVLYDIYERALHKFPDMAMENCASGGGRNDLGMLSRFHYACVSDWTVFPHFIRAFNIMTQFIPPESLCYYHNHMPFAHLEADIETHLRVTLFCQPIFVGFGAQNMQDGLLAKRTKRYIALHKEFCSAILEGSPIVYHHTPYLGLTELEVDFLVLEYALPDRSAGYAGVFRIGEHTNVKSYLLRFGGVSRSKTYDVTFDNEQETICLSGNELIGSGINIFLERLNTSELILYRCRSDIKPMDVFL